MPGAAPLPIAENLVPFVVECQGVVYTIDIGWGESTVRLWDLETETRTQTCH